MKSIIRYIAFILLCIEFPLCINGQDFPIQLDEVSPWCIIGFDSLNRTPIQRIEMLKSLSFKKYGFNKGEGKVDEMEEEFNLALENNIEITSVFLWLNAMRDSLGKLSPSNQEILSILRKVAYKPTLWLSFSHNFFEEKSHDECVALAIEMIRFVKNEADKIGCKIALYNHHGWFGNPYHQLEIIERMNSDSITIVYNFHHAHEYLDEFSEIAKKIIPYLSAVNLNGVKKEGPQILTLGEGDYEYNMIRTLLELGYEGDWGILGHIKTQDVEKVLIKNMAGLESLNKKLLAEGM